MNSDWLKAMVYQIVYYGYDNCYCSNYVGNQFIVAIRHPRGLWYMTNIPQLRAVSRHSALRRAYEEPVAMLYWPYTTPPLALLLYYTLLHCCQW